MRVVVVAFVLVVASAAFARDDAGTPPSANAPGDEKVTTPVGRSHIVSEHDTSSRLWWMAGIALFGISTLIVVVRRRSKA